MAQREFVQFLVAASRQREDYFHRASEQAEKGGYKRARAREVLDRKVLFEVEDVLRQSGDDISSLTEDLISHGIPIQTLIELGNLTDEFWLSVAGRSVQDIEGTRASIHMRLLETTSRSPLLKTRLYSVLYPSPSLLDSG